MTYTSTETSTVQDKEKFAKHFKHFVETGYSWGQFHTWFYNRLSSMFGHIIHYDRTCFYATWFTSDGDTEDWKRWENRIMSWTAYGDPEYTWSDVENDLAKWLVNYRETGIWEQERFVTYG